MYISISIPFIYYVCYHIFARFEIMKTGCIWFLTVICTYPVSVNRALKASKLMGLTNSFRQLHPSLVTSFRSRGRLLEFSSWSCRLFMRNLMISHQHQYLSIQNRALGRTFVNQNSRLLVHKLFFGLPVSLGKVSLWAPDTGLYWTRTSLSSIISILQHIWALVSLYLPLIWFGSSKSFSFFASVNSLKGWYVWYYGGSTWLIQNRMIIFFTHVIITARPCSFNQRCWDVSFFNHLLSICAHNDNVPHPYYWVKSLIKPFIIANCTRLALGFRCFVIMTLVFPW